MFRDERYGSKDGGLAARGRRFVEMKSGRTSVTKGRRGEGGKGVMEVLF